MPGKRKGLLAILIALLFWGLFYIGISHHEMWRDELQVWALVKSSPSVTSLLYNMRYEGHPALWHILVYVLAQFSNTPFSMAFLHIAIAGIVVFIVIRYSPFVWWQKLLLISGYYFVYEYAVISRNYSIEVLFILIICKLLQEYKTHLISLSILLFMLCQCNAFGIIMALGFSSVLIVKFVSEKQDYKKAIFPLLIIGLGLLLGAWQIIPPADGTFSNTWSFFPLSDGTRAASRICTAFFPLPQFKYAFWDTSIFTNPYLSLAVSISIGFICIIRYRSKPPIFFFYISTTVSLWLFFYLRFHGSVRHHGHFYIIFIICEWLYLSSVKRDISTLFNKFFNVFFITVLAIQFIAGIYSFSRDIGDTFSESEAVSAYIKNKGLDSIPLIGYPDFAAVPVMARLGKPFYSLTRKANMNYTIWDGKRDRAINDNILITQAKAVADSTQKDHLLLINKQLKINGQCNFIQLIGVFNDAIVPDEVYSLYKIRHDVK